MKNYNELKDEAKNLGIEFSGNISKNDLLTLIEQHYESQAADDFVQVKEEKVEEKISDNPEAYIRKLVVSEKRKAMAKQIVTITSNDKRDNEYTTTAYLGFENQYFGIDRIVPLDIPVELEQCLIEIAKSTMITLHKDEIINGRRTGNKIPVRTRKYNVSIER